MILISRSIHLAADECLLSQLWHCNTCLVCRSNVTFATLGFNINSGTARHVQTSIFVKIDTLKQQKILMASPLSPHIMLQTIRCISHIWMTVLNVAVARIWILSSNVRSVTHVRTLIFVMMVGLVPVMSMPCMGYCISKICFHLDSNKVMESGDIWLNWTNLVRFINGWIHFLDPLGLHQTRHWTLG